MKLMLVLTRKVGESLIIGDDVKVTILSVRGAEARIGVEADESIPIHREEIYMRIKQQQKHSTS